MNQKCPYCGSKKVQRRGQYPRQRFCCTDSKHPEGMSRYFYGETSPTKVLLFDIETLPIIFYGWKLWDMITSPEMIKQDWCVLSYSAKWLFKPEIMTGVLTPKQAIARDDKKLVQEIWKLFEAADVVIAHNGVKFDLSRMNTRFLYYDMAPPTPYQNIDTLLTARKYLGFTANHLDYLGEYLGLGRKHKTDIEWWIKCDQGDPEYLTMMNEYNVRDITLLEDVYVKLRPWIKHPNMSLFVHTDDAVEVCPRCASDDIIWSGEYHTEASVFDAFRCNHCGGVGRAKKKSSTSGTRSVNTL